MFHNERRISATKTVDEVAHKFKVVMYCPSLSVAIIIFFVKFFDFLKKENACKSVGIAQVKFYLDRYRIER